MAETAAARARTRPPIDRQTLGGDRCTADLVRRISPDTNHFRTTRNHLFIGTTLLALRLAN
eukprot:10754917-Alexandrium_andersonii.AAC.1